jgi:hypothetical protein
MRKLLLATATVLALAGTANASGWYAYYDCGNGVVPIISGWRGKMWLSVQDNQNAILEDKKFFDGGIDSLEENPKKLNADVDNFRFRIKWHHKTVILRYRRSEDSNKEITFGGHFCRFMGTKFDDEVQLYDEDFKKWKVQH